MAAVGAARPAPISAPASGAMTAFAPEASATAPTPAQVPKLRKYAPTQRSYQRRRVHTARGWAGRRDRQGCSPSRRSGAARPQRAANTLDRTEL
jgi:hypothetical protein